MYKNWFKCVLLGFVFIFYLFWMCSIVRYPMSLSYALNFTILLFLHIFIMISIFVFNYISILFVACCHCFLLLLRYFFYFSICSLLFRINICTHKYILTATRKVAACVRLTKKALLWVNNNIHTLPDYSTILIQSNHIMLWLHVINFHFCAIFITYCLWPQLKPIPQSFRFLISSQSRDKIQNINLSDQHSVTRAQNAFFGCSLFEFINFVFF